MVIGEMKVIGKEDLLNEWNNLTAEYEKNGLMEDTEEAFLAGQIVEVENLLDEFFKEQKEFFGVDSPYQEGGEKLE